MLLKANNASRIDFDFPSSHYIVQESTFLNSCHELHCLINVYAVHRLPFSVQHPSYSGVGSDGPVQAQRQDSHHESLSSTSIFVP